MARDPLDRLKADLDESVPSIEPLGTEADPDREFFVADVPEMEVDEAASIAEEQGFDEITFEPSPSGPGRETVRFGRKRR